MNTRQKQTVKDFAIAQFVASPACAKYGLVIGVEGNEVNVFWEGHDVPYFVLPTAMSPIAVGAVPKSVKDALMRKASELLEDAA